MEVHLSQFVCFGLQMCTKPTVVLKPAKKGGEQPKREKGKERVKTKQSLRVSDHANPIQPN